MSAVKVPVRASSGRVVAVEEVAPVSRITRAEYDAITDRVNFSTLKLMGKSPAHYRDRILNPPGPDSDAMRLGRATHIAILEPHLFERECVQWTEGRRAGKAWEAFAAEHATQEILTDSEWECLLGMCGAVRTHDEASRYLMEGAAEQTLLWEDVVPEVGGLPEVRTPCKGRLDWIGRLATVDLKTTRDASPEAVERAFFNLGYHVQAAFYSDGYEAATGTRLPFVVIAVESSSPYVVQVYEVPEELLDLGRETYRTWLARRAMCIAEAEWPGYSTQTLPLTLPRWARPADGDDISDLDLA